MYIKMVFITLILSFLSITSCNNDRADSKKTKIDYSSNDILTDSIPKLTENQKNILEGARTTLENGAEYDLSMGYYVLKYEDGKYMGKKIYPNGDLDPNIGVCTDVIVRSLRKAGIVDLQEAIHEDLNENWGDYPTWRWGLKKPDSNIDHRRVMNLEVWFSKYWQEMDYENFKPGDIVVWDMNQDGANDHIGIVADKKENNRYYVIHNHPNPGYIAEEDKLFRWEMTGHYRIPE
jgi:uncharacterized protein YijF (DUF1287 family)